MTFALRAWPRGQYEAGGGAPFLVYYVYGNFAELPSMRVDKYNSSGVPKGMDLQMYNRQQHPEVLDGFLGGYFGKFLHEKSDIEKPVLAARHCIVLKGEPLNDTSLDYFRDVIGTLMYLLDCGGECVLDPQILTWWRRSEWEEVFSSEALKPARHVVVIGSPEENNPNLTWLHTRGLRKFGRPDLSVHNVAEEQRPQWMELFESFINYQALGGVISEGQEVALEGFEGIFRMSHRGDDNDLDFNNRHVEIELV